MPTVRIRLAFFKVKAAEMWKRFQGVSKVDNKNTIPRIGEASGKLTRTRKPNLKWQAGPTRLRESEKTYGFAIIAELPN